MGAPVPPAPASVKGLVPAAVAMRGRKAWQDFKKAHPDFGRSHSLKLDLGPSIDQYEKTLTVYTKESVGFQKRLDLELAHIHAALSAYRVVVDQANNPAMKRDFANFSVLATKSPSEWRRAWQDFKKKYPDFEKTKSFKADLGPHLDKFAKAIDASEKIGKQLDTLLKRAQSELNQIKAALAGYESIVGGSNDPGMKRDFAKVKSALQGK